MQKKLEINQRKLHKLSHF